MIVAEAMSMIVVVDLLSLSIFSIDIKKKKNFLKKSLFHIHRLIKKKKKQLWVPVTLIGKVSYS